MPHDDQLFTSEEVDEQIDWLERAASAQPPTPHTTTNIRVIQGLHRLYENEQADAQSVDAVWQRLLERGPVPAQQPQRARPSGPPRRQRDSGPPPQAYAPAASARRGLSTRLLAIVAAALLVVVVSGLVAGIILVRQHSPLTSNPPPTAQPGQTAQSTQMTTGSEIAYIGSDGNVWEMTWPGGTPKQLTTDAQTGQIFYSGPTWSPDGSLLAVVRQAYTNNGLMLIMKPDGTVVVHAPLPGARTYDIPFAWSPDSTMLAFRGEVTVDATDNNGTRKLLLFDAHTGQVVNTLTYQVGGASGCGGGGPTSDLTQAIWLAEDAGFQHPQDAFVWAPDGHSLLFTRTAPGSCGRGQGIQVDLSTGATNAPYPLLGSYQPGGNLILGYWSDGTLGLTDLSANHVRALVGPEPSVNPPQYMVTLGRAAWANDGQTVYYEHNDSIWQIGVDASNPHQVIAGTALDSQQNATVQLLPHPSPDGHMLLYLQVRGSDRVIEDGIVTPQPTPTIPLTTRWYVAQADGSNPVPLPQGVKEAVWRPGK